MDTDLLIKLGIIGFVFLYAVVMYQQYMIRKLKNMVEIAYTRSFNHQVQLDQLRKCLNKKDHIC